MLKRILLILLTALLLAGCNKRVAEAPENENTIWGFGETNAYQYYAEEFTDMVVSLAGTMDVTNEKYQQQVKESIEKLKNAGVYSIDHPLFILNPYGTLPGTLYVYMGELQERPYISYSVSVPDLDIPDFEASFYFEAKDTYVLEGQIVGFMTGKLNKLNIIAANELGEPFSEKGYEFIISDIDYNTSNYRNIKTLSTEYSSDKQAGELTVGMYSFFDIDNSAYLFYDNYGTLRARIITKASNPAYKVLPADNLIFYPLTNHSFSICNHKGESIYNIQFDENIEVKDYEYDSINRRILILVSNKENLELYTVPLKDGELSKLIHFDEVERLKLLQEEAGFGELELYTIDGKDIIISSLEVSSVFRINNIDTKPVVRWVFSKKELWKDTIYDVIVLDNLIQYQYGDRISSIDYYNIKKQKEGTFYLTMMASINHNSYFYKFMVDENKNVYELVEKFLLNGQGAALNIKMNGEHVIVSNETGGLFSEYNNAGTELIRFSTGLKNKGLRVYKYSMSRYWF